MMSFFMMINTGEEQSRFEKLYRAYRGLMFYVANRILQNEQDAEDAVQQAFMKIAENMDKIDALFSPKTRSYVVTIVENKAIDLYRAKQRTGTVEYGDAAGLTVEPPEEKGLAGCILQLPPRLRQVILLKYYHGFTLREIAKQLGITQANAEKLHQRAKSKLREICEKEGIL